MLRRIVIALTSVLIAACSTTTTSNNLTSKTVDANIHLVTTFIEAFNQRNLEGMLAVVSSDVQWLSIDGKNVSVITNDRAELSTSLASYFEQCTTCRSRVENIITNSNRVSVTEVASWEVEGKIKSQSSLSVYEIDGNLIKRVYYFPADGSDSKE